ncbi:MAG: ribonuclease E/G [Parachlamydiales bacterium]|nr:ribonuclease E/G [Parachlamydiales bacterium]
MKEILLNIESKEIRYAYLKFGVLHDLVIERKKSHPITGNIYRGRVTNILHNIQSAFIDIGEGENGFIHISDIVENRKKFEEMFDMDFDTEYEGSSKSATDFPSSSHNIEKILKIDQPVLVQVVKEPTVTKGARLTSNLSIPGRYLVLLPNTTHRGVSRKIENSASRERLKKLIRAFEMPKDMGLICRTASSNASQEMLIAEASELLKTWETIVDKFHAATGPTCLFEESDIIKKAILTAINKKLDRILIDDFTTYKKCQDIYKTYAQEHSLKIELYRDKVPLFERFNLEKEIEKALQRKVWLKSGGYLFIDRTEAMLTIDVNSGRSLQQEITKNVEEMLVQINLEAADEIGRQLRLRNAGGLIICDFIDMRLRKNRRRVLEKLKEAMKEDSAKCTILGMSEFGLIEMTRQRSRKALAEILFSACPYCSGQGAIKSHESTLIEMERSLKKLLFWKGEKHLRLVLHPELFRYLTAGDQKYFSQLARSAHGSLEYKTKDLLHLNQFQFFSLDKGKKIDV